MCFCFLLDWLTLNGKKRFLKIWQTQLFVFLWVFLSLFLAFPVQIIGHILMIILSKLIHSWNIFLLHIVLFLYWYNNQTLAYRGAVSHHSRSSWWSDLPYSWRSLSLYPGNLPSALYTTLHLYRCMEREQVCKVRGRRVKDIRQEVGREEGKSGNRGRDWKKRVIRVWTNSSNEGRKD